MAFRSSNYPLTGLGFATGQNPDASSQSSLTDAASGSTPSDVKMTEFIVDNTDTVGGPADIGVGVTQTYTQKFVGESSRFSVIKNVAQNFNWTPSDTSIVDLETGADFTVEATSQTGGSSNLSSSFHDRYNTVSSQSGGDLNINAGNCDFSGTPGVTNFDSLGPSSSGFPEIRAELTIDNTTYGDDGSLTTSNFEICENFALQTIKNINFAEGSGSKLDMVIVMDDSGSMDNEISDIQNSLTGSGGLVQDIENEGFDARYALISYKDDEEIDQSYTTDSQAFENAINNLAASGGGDALEDGVDALGAALSQKSADLSGFSLSQPRADAQKVVIQITDEGSHKVGQNTNGTTTFSQTDAETAINNEQVQYFAIAPQTISSGGVSHKDIAQNVDNGQFEELGSADFQSIFNSIVEGVTQASYRLFYDTTNDTADGSTRNVQVKVIPPSGSGDSEMVVERQYTA